VSRRSWNIELVGGPEDGLQVTPRVPSDVPPPEWIIAIPMSMAELAKRAPEDRRVRVGVYTPRSYALSKRPASINPVYYEWQGEELR
jgi:hypothetical protein